MDCFDDFAAVGLGVAGGGIGAGVTGEGVALADLLCFEDLEAVGKLVGRFVGGLDTGELVGPFVGELDTGELVGGSLSGSSPPPQTNIPDSSSLHTLPQHVPKGLPSTTVHGSPKAPHLVCSDE